MALFCREKRVRILTFCGVLYHFAVQHRTLRRIEQQRISRAHEEALDTAAEGEAAR